MKKLYYSFAQYPSGGGYHFTDTEARFVVIQAFDPIKANLMALIKGLYFDGVKKQIDCSCCEDRWLPLSQEAEGFDKPMLRLRGSREIYKPLRSFLSGFVSDGYARATEKLAYIYYMDGEKELVTGTKLNDSNIVFKFERH
jgi:hypothetical protein